MLDYFLVDVKSINSDVPRSQFQEAELDHLADLILEVGGLLKPLSLRQGKGESYTVVEGHREYYAAVRAREKDPRKGEMINAFILSIEDESKILNQSEALMPQQKGSTSIKAETSPLDLRLTNLDTRLDQAILELKSNQKSEIQRLESEIHNLKERIPKPLEPLTAFNTLDAVALTKMLNRAGIKGKRADAISSKVLSERKKKQFADFQDIVKRINGFSDKSLITVLDSLTDII